MSSSNTNSDLEHTPSAQAPTFTFGEYISPNPKPIPLGVRLHPDPLIEYQTKNVVQYETKTESQPLGDEHHQNNQQMHQQRPATNANVMTSTATARMGGGGRVAGTPAKVKVKKQAKQIVSLQAQLDQMRIENEKLKSSSQSQSTSLSPRNETVDINREPKHIVFEQSVKVIDCLSSPKKEQINDRASLVRSKRNHTPHKASAKFDDFSLEQKSKDAHATLMTKAEVAPAVTAQGGRRRIKMNHAAAAAAPAQEHNGDKHSRGMYRITPIPTKPRRKRIAFKSKLTKCKENNGKENVNANQQTKQPNQPQTKQQAIVADTADTPQMDREKLEQFVTPNQSFNEQAQGTAVADCTPQQSFNLGKGVVGTPSVSEANSFLEPAPTIEDTPDFMHKNAGRGGGNGNGASNVATPILTPVKDTKAAKPFTFAWNQQ